MSEEWSRADKINLSIVLTACLAIALPYGLQLLRFIQRPQAAIIAPVSGVRVLNNTFGANGTARNIPADSELWLVVKSGVEGRWYPWGPLSVSGGRWAVPPDRICPGYGPQYLQVFKVTDTETGDLFAFIRGSQSLQRQGINSLPPGAVLEASTRVIVGEDSRKFC